MYFQRKPVLKDVMAAVERIASQVYGDLPALRREQEPLSLARIVHAYADRSREPGEEWLTLPQLKDLLTQLEPAFTPRQCGYKDLSHMLRENTTLFEVRRRASKGRPIEVRFLPQGGSPEGDERLPVRSPEIKQPEQPVLATWGNK